MHAFDTHYDTIDLVDVRYSDMVGYAKGGIFWHVKEADGETIVIGNMLGGRAKRTKVRTIAELAAEGAFARRTRYTCRDCGADVGAGETRTHDCA